MTVTGEGPQRGHLLSKCGKLNKMENDSRMILGKSDMENPSSDGRSTGLAGVSLLGCRLNS